MKNGEAILEAAKALMKEIGIGVQEERDSIRDAADKVVSSYKDGTISENVKQTFEKGAAVAGTFISNQVDSIEKEIRKAKEQVEKRKQEKQAESPVEAEAEPASDEVVEEVPVAQIIPEEESDPVAETDCAVENKEQEEQ